MQDVGIPDDAAPPADRTTEEGAAACEATRPSRLSERLPEFYPDITNCDQLSSDDESASEDARMEYLLCQPADKVCNSMWYGARDMPVAADAGASMITVGQYATMQKLAFLQSRQTIDGHNKTAAAALALLSDTVTLDPSNPVAQPFLRGENSVHNEYSRVPSSKRACDNAVGVPSADRYTLHVCWRDGCTHWWLHCPKCTHCPEGDACPVCFCPKCGTHRYKVVDGKARPRECFLMWDVFEQFFLDAQLCSGILKARRESVLWSPRVTVCNAWLFVLDKGMVHTS